MEATLDKLAKSLEPLFKGLPPLPKIVKDWFVQFWPIVALVIGILQLIAAWSLWHVGHFVDSLANSANELSRLYGTGAVVANHLSIFYWLSLILLVVDAVILLLAYPGLKARSKAGWNMLFLGALVNGAYGLFSVFDSTYGGVGKLVMALVTTAVVFYFLFQVRSHYGAKAEKAND